MQTCQAFHHNILKLALMTLQDRVNVHNAEERQQEQHRTMCKKATEKLSKARQIIAEYA